MTFKIPLADLNYGPEEEQAVLGVMQSRWLTMGGVTQEFETEFARFTGARHALALSNATVALHLACLSLGIGPGDEVIVPTLTFVASANAVLYTGAEVRFAGVCGAHDLNASPEEIERQITPHTRAILVVHYGGYPCRMPEIVEIARRHNLAVIEDAAHAPGARLDGRHLGLWGEAGCFSFFSNKNLSVGEGGMLITNQDDIAEKVRLLRSHGMTTLTWDRHKGHAHSYDVVELGYNYRIDEVRSALGLVQLGKLAEGNNRRAALTRRYWEKLKGYVELPFKNTDGVQAVEPSYHIFPVLLPGGVDRGKLIDSMKAAGIQTSIHYPSVHRFSYYQKRYPGLSLPLTEEIAAREVTLPLYPTLTEKQQDVVIEAVKDFINQPA